MSILAGVKGYLTYVTLGYKSLLELRRSLGDVDPLNLIKDKDATLQKGQEHADVLTRIFDDSTLTSFSVNQFTSSFSQEFYSGSRHAKMADGFIKTKKINVDDRATGDFDVDVDLGGS